MFHNYMIVNVDFGVLDFLTVQKQFWELVECLKWLKCCICFRNRILDCFFIVVAFKHFRHFINK